MQLDKAIEVWECYFYGKGPVKHGELCEATKLAIEALKRIASCRETPFHCMVDLLPGETRD
ncbi:hypothetical protein LCGC14_0848550 [marine sediment metagenome]|uniref:Uncharacterized protein n=1 Tax=marine sediment metagenome TaxID=412755 RepID=A0A0F9PFR8_9ZZZZ